MPPIVQDFPVELTPQKRQGPMRRIRKPQWTQAPSPSFGAASLGRGMMSSCEAQAARCVGPPFVAETLPDSRRFARSHAIWLSNLRGFAGARADFTEPEFLFMDLG